MNQVFCCTVDIALSFKKPWLSKKAQVQNDHTHFGRICQIRFDGSGLRDHIYVQGFQHRLDGVDQRRCFRPGEQQANHVAVHVQHGRP